MFQMVYGDKTLKMFQEKHPDFDISNFKNRKQAYSDDMLLFGTNDDRKTYLMNVRCAFFCMNYHGLTIQPHKTRFFARTYNFLGNTIDLSDKTIRVQSWKIDAIQHWDSPTSRVELLSRLCCLQYVGQHLTNWKSIGAELFELLKEEGPYVWTIRHERRWSELKFLVKVHLALTIPSPDDYLVATSDASQIGCSAILMAFKPAIRKLLPVACLSRLFSRHVLRRSVLAKEATGGGIALTKFERLIKNSNNKTTYVMDAFSILFSRNYSKLNSAIFNFSLLLSSFGDQVQVLAIAGEMNFMSDALSRYVTNARPAREQENKDELEMLNRNLFNFDSPVLFSMEDVQRIMHEPALDVVDIHPTIEYERTTLQSSPIKTLEDMFAVAENPPELAFLRLSADKIADETRKHLLWSHVKRLKKTKPLTDNDVEMLVKKYRLRDMDLRVFNYHADLGGNANYEAETGEGPGGQPESFNDTGGVRAYEHKLDMMCPQPDPDTVHICDKSFCTISESNKRFVDNLHSYLLNLDETVEQQLPKPGPGQNPNPEVRRPGLGPDPNPNPEVPGSGPDPDPKGPSGPSGPSPGPVPAPVHYRPNVASGYVKMMKQLLQTTGGNPELLIRIKKFHIAKRPEKIKLYRACLEYAETLAEEGNIDYAMFMPVHTNEEADIVLERGLDSLEIKMKDTVHLKKGEMKILNIFSLILINGRDLYLDPVDKLAKKTLLNIPDGIKVGDGAAYFHAFYVVPNENLTINKGETVFFIRGMFPRFTKFEIEKPICVENDGQFETEIQCNHQTYIGHSTIRYAVIPTKCKNDLTQKLYEKLRKYFQYNCVSSNLAIWSLMSHAEGRHQKNKPDLGTPSEKKKRKNPKKSAPPNDPRDFSRSNDPRDFSDTDTQTRDDNYADTCRKKNNLTFITQILSQNKIFSRDLTKYFLSFEDYFACYNDPKFVKIDNLLYAPNTRGQNKQGHVLVVPLTVARMICQHMHSTDGRHHNARQLREIFQRQFHQASSKGHLYNDTVEQCTICQMNHPNRNLINVGTVRTFKPQRAYEILIADNLHGLPTTPRGMNGALVVVDALTNFAWIIPTSTTTQESMILSMSSIFATFGPPSCVLTDSASSFQGAFSSWLSSQGCYHHRMTTARSQSVGACEVSIKNIREMLTRVIAGTPDQRQNWDLMASRACRAYNLTSLYNTKIPRSDLFFGSTTNLYSNEVNFYSFREEDIVKAKQDLSNLRESRRSSGFHKIYTPGSVVTRHIPTKSAAIVGDSRYLQNSGKHIYKILDSCAFSVLLRSQSTGAVVCCTPSELRLINLNTDKDIQFPSDHRFLNSMTMSRYKPGNQAFYDPPHTMLGSLPQYETVRIPAKDPASILVKSDKPPPKSKRLQIREELNRIHRV